MFHIHQIMSATDFIRSFRKVSRYLALHPEPLLITQRSGRFIVIMDGELFEEIMGARHTFEETHEQTTRRVQHDSGA